MTNGTIVQTFYGEIGRIVQINQYSEYDKWRGYSVEYIVEFPDKRKSIYLPNELTEIPSCKL